MLVQLNISNFAIIKQIELCLNPGINILSGETGAGKSIIINAINLILGKRASTELIRSGCDEASVEALFSFPKDQGPVKTLSDMDISFDSEILIKRTVYREGRNKISINGSMATLQMLTRLGMALISISGQHEHQLLLKAENHIYLLDDFGGLARERIEFSDIFHKYQLIKENIKKSEQRLGQIKQQQDLEEFQIHEIEDANISQEEEDVLAAERSRLQHANELMGILSNCHQLLYENNDSAFSVIARCVKEMEKGADIDQRLASPKEALSETGWKIEDVAMTIKDIQKSIRIDPQRLEQVNDRIDLFNRLKKKYGPALKDVMDFKEGLASRIHDLKNKQDQLIQLKKEKQTLFEETITMAGDLSRKRKKAAKVFEKEVKRELGFLHMEETRFQVRFNEAPVQRPDSPDRTIAALSADGLDYVEFMMSPNIGEDLRPLSKTASGGELSRIILAIKTILARSASVETIIFDEVDSGVSGATAEAVGEKLVSLSDYHQLVCITHLPQIASKGKIHFKVKKEVSKGRTRTVISKLDLKERTYEIARLLGGHEITPQALANAEEMLRKTTQMDTN
jgi:DNA repair protein RecN (Recombination protein N)